MPMNNELLAAINIAVKALPAPTVTPSVLDRRKFTQEESENSDKIIAQIPTMIAKARNNDQNFCVATTVYDMDSGLSWNGMRFQFPSWKILKGLYEEPKREWLRGASQLVFDYCSRNGLSPEFGKIRWRLSGYSGAGFCPCPGAYGSDLIIHWVPLHLERALKATE
jgi:hypothetical protein